MLTHRKPRRPLSSRWLAAVPALLLLALPSLAPAQAVFTKLDDFNIDDGQHPMSGMVFGPDGNLYGTTRTGGSTTVTPASQGCVYSVSPAGGNLHRFVSFYDVRGLTPYAPLIVGSDGNFYTTTSGGSVPGPNNTTESSYGTIIQIKPDGTVTALYSFPYAAATQNYPHGLSPEGPLLEISPGVFLGTTAAGGNDGGGSSAVGTVFEYNLGTGTLSTLFTEFGTNGADDGNNPKARIIPGGNGLFYTTTAGGGPSLLGNIIQFSTAAGSNRKLFDFTNQSGTGSQGGLTLGPDGKLYGVTEAGGSTNNGTYYRISTAGGFELLGNFTGPNGQQPFGELVLASDGNFYGTTSFGGDGGLGTVFQLTTAGVLTTLYSFPGSGAMGYSPEGTLVQGPDGRLYGNTVQGGAGGAGTVFALSLNPFITSASSASLDAGQSFSYQVTATNTPTKFAATGLPAGLSINATTGLISGTLTHSGVYTVTLSATNAMGTGTATLNVNGHPPFFTGEAALGQGVYYLAFPANGNIFGYYSYLSNPNYVYHFDLGYEYVFDANDGHGGAYLYDFTSQDFFYTSPAFAFPYLYDFGLQATLYYYPSPTNPQRYNTNGVRYFFNFSTGKIISK